MIEQLLFKPPKLDPSAQQAPVNSPSFDWSKYEFPPNTCFHIFDKVEGNFRRVGYGYEFPAIVQASSRHALEHATEVIIAVDDSDYETSLVVKFGPDGNRLLNA